jgi:glycine dehydrogenase subunit 1
MSYIPNTGADRKKMLAAVGVDNIDDLFQTIPEPLRFERELEIPGRMDQIALSRHAADLAKMNIGAGDMICFLGAGIYDHYVPPTVGAVLGRSEFYTAYTPYQPEVSQGVLQSIFEFQSLICQLTGMEAANASMYDGATALAESSIMAREITGRKKVLLAGHVNPAYKRVIDTYTHHIGIAVETIAPVNGVIDLAAAQSALDSDTAALIAQQPDFFGIVNDMPALSRIAHKNNSLFISSFDPISLGILAPPGEYDADIAVAEGQSLGCPMGFGGPLLGLFACKNEFLRRMPGRIVGQTKDIDGKTAYVMTLRTREQDIRRERATSNICTNEALYALAAAVYLSTTGKQGLRGIAELCLQKSHYAAKSISALPGFELVYKDAPFFKEFVVKTPAPVNKINERLLDAGIIGGYPLDGAGERMLVCVTEQRTKDDIDRLVAALKSAVQSPLL